MINSFTILSNMSFHNLLVLFETSKGPGSGYAPALAHFWTRFCLQVNFETEISYPGRPLLHTQRCGGGRGPPMYPPSIGIACGMRRRVCRALITVLHKSSPHTFLDC